MTTNVRRLDLVRLTETNGSIERNESMWQRIAPYLRVEENVNIVDLFVPERKAPTRACVVLARD
jgi:hypothetical protein